MLDNNNNDDSWESWSRLILSELTRLSDIVKKLEDKSAFNTTEVSKLKIYAAITGGISGTIATLLIREVLNRWP